MEISDAARRVRGGQVRPMPKTKAEDPSLSTSFGFGADAAWGIYLRTGSPLSEERIAALDLADFRTGMLAANVEIRRQHDQNLAVAMQEVTQLRQRIKEYRDDNAKLRAEVKGRRGGGKGDA